MTEPNDLHDNHEWFDEPTDPTTTADAELPHRSPARRAGTNARKALVLTGIFGAAALTGVVVGNATADNGSSGTSSNQVTNTNTNRPSGDDDSDGRHQQQFAPPQFGGATPGQPPTSGSSGPGATSSQGS